MRSVRAAHEVYEVKVLLGLGRYGIFDDARSISLPFTIRSSLGCF
ncbi:hypothetical protein BH23ACT12_BH23ACT12_24340 [soil metagenome]